MAGVTYYVSRNGNNGDGRSWSSAWNELDQIEWGVVQPGDTIVIDGGVTACSYPVVVTGSSNAPTPVGCGMVYRTELTVGKSGTASSPITIKLAEEAGRNGTALLFGGRNTPLPYCGQSGYSPDRAGTEVGIYAQGKSYVVVDGTKTGGDYPTNYPNGVASLADPMFADNVFASVGPGSAAFDFTITNPAIPAGRGSSITSPAVLFADGSPGPTPTLPPPTPTSPPSTSTPPPGPTSTPVPSLEVIVDDANPGFSSQGTQDAWQEYVQAGGQHYGGSHHYNHLSGTGQDVATWSFAVPQPGQYAVYAWWWEGSGSPSKTTRRRARTSSPMRYGWCTSAHSRRVRPFANQARAVPITQ